jgi:alpha-tubulin suppressor-like RCC1 family protein
MQLIGLRVVQVSAGTRFSLFLLDNGDVYSAGNNSSYELGRLVDSGASDAPNLGKITGLPPSNTYFS